MGLWQRKKSVNSMYTWHSNMNLRSIPFLTKGLIDTDLATAAKEKFYDSLNKGKLRTAKKTESIMKL